MSLKIRFRFDGKCIRHPRYNPKRHGRPRDGECDGCESLYVIHFYTKIAEKKAHSSTGIISGMKSLTVTRNRHITCEWPLPWPQIVVQRFLAAKSAQ